MSIRTIELGPVAYRVVELEAIDNTTGQRFILGNAQDQSELYSGQDVSLIGRRGMLGPSASRSP